MDVNSLTSQMASSRLSMALEISDLASFTVVGDGLGHGSSFLCILDSGGFNGSGGSPGDDVAMGVENSGKCGDSTDVGSMIV